MVGGLPTATINGLAVNPTEPKVMYAAMREGVFRSEDGGGRWTHVGGGPKNAAAVAVDPKRPAKVVVATTDARIFLSRDGGRTWEAQR